MKSWQKGVIIGWVFMMGCLGRTSATRAESPAEAEVRQAMVEVIAAATRLDAEGIMARLDPDPATRYFVQGQSFNYADLTVFLRTSFADMKSQQVIWLESSARELAPDTVLWTSCGRNPVVEANGRELEYLLAETWVWKKAGTVWRAVHYQESFLNLPSEEKREQVQAALTAFAATFKADPLEPQKVLPALEEFVRSQKGMAGSAFGFAPREGVELAAPYVCRKGHEYVKKTMTADSKYIQSGWYSGPATSGKPTWSEPYFDAHGAEIMMITYGVPVFDPQGLLLGVLTADLALY